MRERRTGPAPWDPGLQNERTALAWTRTVLSLLGAALVVARLAAATHLALAITLAAGSLVLGGTALYLVGRRHRRAAASLYTERPLPDGRLPAAATVLVVLIGVIGLMLL